MYSIYGEGRKKIGVSFDKLLVKTVELAWVGARIMSETKKTKEMLERKREFRTTVDGVVVNRVYSPADLAGLNQEDIGRPGEYPFTRHIMPSGYRSRLWTMRQYAGFGTVEETNERYKYLYEKDKPGLVLPSICLLRKDMIRTILWLRERWGNAVSPSILWRTWKSFGSVFRWPR